MVELFNWPFLKAKMSNCPEGWCQLVALAFCSLCQLRRLGLGLLLLGFLGSFLYLDLETSPWKRPNSCIEGDHTLFPCSPKELGLGLLYLHHSPLVEKSNDTWSSRSVFFWDTTKRIGLLLDMEIRTGLLLLMWPTRTGILLHMWSTRIGLLINSIENFLGCNGWPNVIKISITTSWNGWLNVIKKSITTLFYSTFFFFLTMTQ